MFRVGDRIYTKEHGKGTIEDFPNEGMAWVKYDNDPKYWVRGVRMDKLEKTQNLNLIDGTNQVVEETIQIVRPNFENVKFETIEVTETTHPIIRPKLSDKAVVLSLHSKPDPMLGPGGAPTRSTILPTDAAGRKNYPIASGVLDYFPDAVVAIAGVSKAGNDQHNPGMSLRWTRGKSTDEADTCIRHFMQRGTLDNDGIRHTAKAAWRLLALLQKEIEGENK